MSSDGHLQDLCEMQQKRSDVVKIFQNNGEPQIQSSAGYWFTVYR